jgi:hypothetical protein
MEIRDTSLIMYLIIALFLLKIPSAGAELSENKPHVKLTGTWVAVQNENEEFFVATFDWKTGTYSGKVFNKNFTQPLKLVEEYDNIVIITAGSGNMKVEIIDDNHIIIIDGHTKVPLERKKSVQAALTKRKTDSVNLPAFELLLNGQNEVRVRNPNNFIVSVGLRSGKHGKDFHVAENGVASVFMPDGKYQIFFVYSNKPDALFQGDDFTLNNSGIEIQIVKVVSGNYGIRRVK